MTTLPVGLSAHCRGELTEALENVKKRLVELKDQVERCQCVESQLRDQIRTCEAKRDALKLTLHWDAKETSGESEIPF